MGSSQMFNIRKTFYFSQVQTLVYADDGSQAAEPIKTVAEISAPKISEANGLGC